MVRVGQSDAENGDLTLTVDPPSFTHSTVSSVNTHVSTDPGGLVDPFLEMDQEQLERLETALHSEEAKHILGENVTAMLGTLHIILFLLVLSLFFFATKKINKAAVSWKFCSTYIYFFRYVVNRRAAEYNAI